jgi:hypothetical protein
MADLIGVLRSVILYDDETAGLNDATENGHYHFVPHPFKFSILLCYLTTSPITKIILNCSVGDNK